MFSISAFPPMPSESDHDDIAHPSKRGALFRDLADALHRGVVTFGSSDKMVVEKVPFLAAVETAEIERYFNALACQLMKDGEGCIVVLDSERKIVHSIDFLATAQEDMVLDQLATWVCQTNRADGPAIGVQSFEAYALPPGKYADQPVLARKRGVPFATIRLDTSDGSVETSWGVNREFEPGYRLVPESVLADDIDLDELPSWSDRRLVRALDRLLEDAERCGGELGNRSFDTAQPDVGRNRLSIALFSLCAALYRKLSFRLFELPDLRLAMEHLPSEHDADLPRWIAKDWSHYVSGLEGRLIFHESLRRDMETSLDPSRRPVENAAKPGCADPIEVVAVDCAGASDRIETAIDGANVVVFDGERHVVMTGTFRDDAGGDALLAAVGIALQRKLPRSGLRHGDRAFEVFAVAYDLSRPSDGPGIREAGIPLGLVTLDGWDGHCRLERLSEMGEGYQYPFQDDRYLVERLDVSNVSEWALRKIVRTLDRLVTEHYWIDNHGLVAPFEDFEHRVATHGDARIRDTIQRHARLMELIIVKVFALCATLLGFDKIELASDDELEFALTCSDVEPNDHPELPQWLRDKWDDILNSLAVARSERLVNGPVPGSR